MGLPQDAKVGDRITVRKKLRNGIRDITFEKVPRHGKGGNLSWKIVSNRPAKSDNNDDMVEEIRKHLRYLQ